MDKRLIGQPERTQNAAKLIDLNERSQLRLRKGMEQARQIMQAKARFKSGSIIEQYIAASPLGQKMGFLPGQQITPDLEKAFEDQTNLALIEIDRQLKALGYEAPPEEQFSAQTPAAAYILKHKDRKSYR